MCVQLRIEITVLRFHRVMKNISNVRLLVYIKLSNVFHHSTKPQNSDFNSYIYIL